MRLTSLVIATPQQTSLYFLHLITQSLGKLSILHVIVGNGNKNRFTEGKSSSQAKTPMFTSTQSVLNFPNDMIKFSSSGSTWGNIGPPNIFQY